MLLYLFFFLYLHFPQFQITSSPPHTPPSPQAKGVQTIVMGRTMFKVRCLITLRQKLGVQVQLQKDEHVGVHSMFEK